ncbi:MAG: DUF4404 family protein [Planctomycetaceae bacterium]
MTDETLNSTLAKLHETLNDTNDVDEETRTLLLSVTADIQRVLEERGQAASESSPSDESMSGRLKDMVVEFEVNHPQIGGLLERLSDGLANMGI